MKEQPKIYAMQRANGDWFAFDSHGHMRVPVFHDVRTASMSRLRNFEMLLFFPKLVNGRILDEMVDVSGGSEIDFVMVNDATVGLNGGIPMQHSQLSLLVRSAHEYQAVPKNENGFSHSEIPLPPVANESTKTRLEEETSESKGEAESKGVQALAVH